MLRTATVVLVIAVCSTFAEAQQDLGNQVCREAMTQTLKRGTPASLQTKVLRACRAAFSDKQHRLNAEAACDRQALKQKAEDRLPVAYACMTAMSLAYE